MNGSTVPAVLTAESEQLNASWWTTGSGWAHVTVCDHAPLTFGAGSMEAATAFNWAYRDGFAGAGREWYAVFKRQLLGGSEAGLWIQRLIWDPPTEALALAGPAVAVPVGALGYERAGFALWAGSDQASNRIVVAVQLIKLVTDRPRSPELGRLPVPDPRWLDPRLRELGISLADVFEEEFARGRFERPRPDRQVREVAELVLLTANATASLADPSAWSVTILGEGGYDLDAVLEDSTLTCVFRRTPYSLRIPAPGLVNATENFEIDIASGVHAPLTVLRCDVVTRQIKSRDNAVPGAEHPLIQAAEPLKLTAERINRGRVTVSSPRTYRTAAGRASVQASAAPRPSSVEVVLVEEVAGTWHAEPLLEYSASDVPRNQGYWLTGWGQWRRTIVESDAFLAGLLSFDPLAVVADRVGEYEKKKTRLVDVLHHEQRFGAVAFRRIALGDGPPTNVGISVVDINHSQVERPTDHTAGENEQFEPFTRGGARVDNTIGGGLVWHDRADPLALLAYIDMGDGGCRILAETGLQPPQAVLPEEKRLPVAAFAPPVEANARWVETEAGTWTPVALPLYDVSQLFVPRGRWSTGDQLASGAATSGLAVVVDTLVRLVGEDPNASVTLTESSFEDGLVELASALAGLEEPLDVWQLLWAPILAVSAQSGATIYNCRVAVGKHELELRYTSGEERRPHSATITPRALVAEYYFEGAFGQGLVHYRVPVRLESSDIDLWATTAFTFRSLSVSFTLDTSFTPGVLVSEERSRDPLAPTGVDEFSPPIEVAIDESGSSTTALSMKPTNAARVNVQEVKTDFATTWLGALVGFVAVLMGLALITLAAKLVGLLGALSAAMSSPWGWAVAVGLFVAILYLVFVLAPRAVEGLVEREIRQALRSEDTLDALLEGRLLQYAGEALAETIARELLTRADPPELLDSGGQQGRNRFSKGQWLMVFVTDGKCRALIRPQG